MTQAPDILCVGSVLWDVIGRCPTHMPHGADRPGRITRIPGGVALNIAMTLAHFGLRPALLSVLGRDEAGNELTDACNRLGLCTTHIYRSKDLPTDCYMAIEGANGLIAAIADAHSLEAAESHLLAPLTDGTLGSKTQPYAGQIALDGNLTEGLLAEIAASPVLARADLRIAPASPGKAERLAPFLRERRGTLYVNLEEAGLLCQSQFTSAPQAAANLVARGAARALVTNGADTCCDAGPDGLIAERPPEVLVTRVTGAGDTFMAAHIAAERRGLKPTDALKFALQSAATHVSGGVPS